MGAERLTHVEQPRPAQRAAALAPAAAGLLQLQQTCGNQAVLRHLAVQRQPAPGHAVPHERFVIPFDSVPQSAPGETVLFHALFDGAPSREFQYVFTGVGGKFGGAATRAVPGLDSDNVPFVIDSAWDGRSAVTVKLELKRLADGSVVKTWNWTFSRKMRLPTTIRQEQPEDALPLGTSYDYKLGPDLGGDGKIDYGHQTILETFGTPTCNVKVGDLKPDWRKQNASVDSDAAILTHFFLGGGGGANGTFTVDADDKIHDQHDGGLLDKADFEAALTTMKEIRCEIVQTYSVKPGTALARYRITRILKPDGTKLVKKAKL